VRIGVTTRAGDADASIFLDGYEGEA
jgi:hypothetical protein